jgi:hypothetical protein
MMVLSQMKEPYRSSGITKTKSDLYMGHIVVWYITYIDNSCDRKTLKKPGI